MRPVKRQKPLPMPIDSLTITQRSKWLHSEVEKSNPGTGKTHICGDVISQFTREHIFVGESKDLL
mgnify:CR=1 FL=1